MGVLRAHWRVLAAALVVLVAGTAAIAWAERPAEHEPVVYALDRHGHLLASGSKLHPGQRVTVVATGYAAGRLVQSVDAARRRSARVRSGELGKVRLQFRVPQHVRAGRLRAVEFAGRPQHRSRRAMPPSAHVRPRRDPQDLVVTVPLVRRFDYRVGPGKAGHAVDAEDSNGLGTPADGHGGVDGLASTGVDVGALLVVGAALVLAGSMLQRRRRTRQDRPPGVQKFI